MGLFARRSSTVGLDLGSRYVKLAEISHAGDSPEICQVASRPLPPGAVVEGEVVQPGKVAGAVRGLMEDAGLSSREVVAALGGHDIFVKRIETPPARRADASAMIRREAARHVPFDLQSVHFDFQLLPRRPRSRSAEALLVAAKRERVESRMSILAQAGVRVALLDVESLALCNAFSHNYPGAEHGIVALVHMGHEVTSINVLEEGVPTLTRDLPLGSRRFGELLRRVHGLPEEWAEEVMLGRRALDGLERALQTAADVVAVGIERAGALLRTRAAGTGIGRIYLSGGGACVPGIGKAIANRMKTETRLVNPCKRVTVAAGIPNAELLTRTSQLFALAVGLALRTGRPARRM